MEFSFNYPLLLFIIPLAAALVLLTSKRISGLARWRKNTILALRITVIVLLTLCLSGFGLKKLTDSSTTVFVLDRSESSSKSKTIIEEFVREAIKTKNSNEKVGIVTFGANSSVELTPSANPDFLSMQASVNSNFTNMEQALKLASSLIPSGDRKRIVLVGDGRENAGDSLKQARILKQQNVSLDVFPIENKDENEVQLKNISVPESLHLNEEFEISIKVDSTVKTEAVLKLYTDRELTLEKKLLLQEGENNFAFTHIAARDGLITYTAVIDPVEDTVSKNNKAAAFTQVGDAAHILVVQDEDLGASEIIKMLEEDVRITVVKPANAPGTLEEMNKYDAFLISNVSAERLSDKFLNSLEQSVRNSGKGLLVTGGENSYAPGGYYKTALEKILPVNMDIKPKEEHPNLGLLLVIDKSGSMSSGQYGISKIELAKEAAIRSTEVLSKDDTVGVIAFDSALSWVVKPQKPGNLQSIHDAIGTIRADGGTSILPPLEEAIKALSEVKTKLKHIILLTDGQAEKNGYEPLIEEAGRQGITLSTVAVGSEADTELLGALAEGGRGRFYATDEFSDIPKIFAKETFLAGKTYLNNRSFTPVLKSFSEIIKDIKSVPLLDGYVGTTAKDTAKVVFSSDQDDPILATWQYGLGRTAAWTPDAKGLWTSKWLAWEQSPQFWKTLMSWLMQKKSLEDYTLKASMSSGTGTVELTLPPEEIRQGETVEGTLVSPSGAEQPIKLSPVQPGVFRGDFDGDETGVYTASILVKAGDELIKSITSGIAVSYSPEYAIFRKDSTEFMQKLASEGNGRVLGSSGEVFANRLAPVASITDMTPYFLTLMIFLLLLDIAVRRLNLSLKPLEPFMQKTASLGGKAVKAAVKPIRKSGAAKPEPGINPEQPTVETGSSEEQKNNTALPDSHISLLLDKKKRRDKKHR